MYGVAIGHLSCYDWACIASRLGIFRASVRHLSQRHKACFARSMAVLRALGCPNWKRGNGLFVRRLALLTMKKGYKRFFLLFFSLFGLVLGVLGR